MAAMILAASFAGATTFDAFRGGAAFAALDFFGWRRLRTATRRVLLLEARFGAFALLFFFAATRHHFFR
jgi:hypothetical protein